MKPHEETWVAERLGSPTGPTAQIFVVGEDGVKRPFLGFERHQLAARAPFLAREIEAVKRERDNKNAELQETREKLADCEIDLSALVNHIKFCFNTHDDRESLLDALRENSYLSSL